MELQIVIVVPVYNEAGNIEPLIREVNKAFASESRAWQLVLVDDASTDGTWDVIGRHLGLDLHLVAFRHSRNRGQSAAVWTGISRTAAPLICTLDGDLQNDPADLPHFLKLLEEVDFVCGRRTQRRDSKLRRLSSWIARKVRTWSLGWDFADTGCALRAFKRTSLAGVFLFNGVHRFLPILVAGNGSKVREIPVSHRPRTSGVSKYGVWNRLGRGLFDLIGMAWYQKRRIDRVAIETPLQVSDYKMDK